MEPASGRQAELQAKIPDSLQGVPRVCNHTDCGSSNIELKYFDNKEKVGYNQPRFVCRSCQRTFTLGGKVRGEYRKANRRTKKVKADTTTANVQAQGAEASEHNQSKRLDLEGNRSSRRLSTEASSLVSEAAASIETGVETDLQGKTQETNSVAENAVPVQVDDCEDADCDTEEVNGDLKGGDCGCEEALCNHRDRSTLPKNATEPYLLDVQNPVVDFDGEEGDQSKRQSEAREEQTEDHFRHIGEALVGAHVQTYLLKQHAKLHLLDAQVSIHDFHVEKEAMNIDLSCKAFAGEPEDLGVEAKKKQAGKIEEVIVGLRSSAEAAAGGQLVSTPSKYREMVAKEAEIEAMSQVITTMHSKVEEMDVKHVPRSVMVATEEEAKQVKDQVTELVDGSKL